MLLYGAETWVINTEMTPILKGFHNRCARYIARRPIKQLDDGTWETPSTEEVLQECKLKHIEEYIMKRKQKLQQYVEEREIWERCINSKPIAMNANQIVWWKQDLNK